MAKKFGTWDNGAWTGGKKYSCYESHPPLTFTGKDGREYTIYGGSGAHPVVHDADVYIGFNYTVDNPNIKVYPWEEGYRQVTTVNFPITDMQAPADPELFHQLIDWTCNQLQAGKKVHAGCMGGHGRTGTFLAAVVAQMAGMKDAIQYVRKHYCEKAVETNTQIKFLMKEFGVSSVGESKKLQVIGGKSSSWDKTWEPGYSYPSSSGYVGSSGDSTAKKSSPQFSEAKRSIKPVKNAKTLW